MKPIFNYQETLVLDGAMGTMLQAQGLPAGASPDAWSVENPAAVTGVHRAYARAGAQLLLANTFGCHALRQKNGRYPIDTLVRAAVENARAAAPEALVALDIGPLGAFLEPFGDVGADEAVELFAEPVRAGIAADCIMVETMIDLGEAEAAVAAAKRDGNGLPVFCTFSFDDRGRLLTGADVAAVCAAMERAGADAIGCNCGLGPEQLLPLLPLFRSHTRLPLIMKPNAGLPVMRDGKAVYDMPPDRFAEAMRRLYDAGVWALGGCCGTTPAHIESLRSFLHT